MSKATIAVFSKDGKLIKNISRVVIHSVDNQFRLVRYRMELHHVYSNEDSPFGEHILPIIVEGDVLKI